MHRPARFVVALCSSLLVLVGLVPAVTSAASAAPVVAPLAAGDDPGPGLPNEVPSPDTPWIGDQSNVQTFAQVGNTMVAGGKFDDLTGPGGSPSFNRTNVVAFDADTGAIRTGFDPVLNGQVEAVLPGPTAGTVYVAGSFSTVNGDNYSHIVLLDVATGNPVPGFRPAATNGVVNTIDRVGNRLFIGGYFDRAGGADHSGFATLDATTGDLDPYMNLQVAEHHNNTGGGAQGAIGVRKLDITPAGDRLVAIGNFRTVDGLLRDQIVMVTLEQGGAVVTPDWATQEYTPYCFNWAFDSYMRDMSLSPDGSFFVVGVTGGHNNGTLCDTAARFETYASGTSLEATWADYAGGDTIWGIGITDSAVYVGGHQRWMNNPFGSDFANQGAVPRPGMSALDPQTGVPLDWNPGRNPRGVAAFAMYPTADGLWVGSNTSYIGNRRYHRPRIAFFPYQGGRPTASKATGTLPGAVYVAGGQTSSNVLYRVNTGGPEIPAIDGGPSWMADDGATSPFRNSGSNPAGSDSNRTFDTTVPTSTPGAIFDTERWDPGDGEEMQWNFPVPAGQEIEVRIYLANRCDCTQFPGQRIFDVSLEGTNVIDDIDLSAQVGHDVGTMRAFDITSDGNVDIDWGHVVENPLVNGIEIVKQSSGTPSSGVLYRVNAGGDYVPADDAGPDWTADSGATSPLRNSGSNTAGWDSNRTLDATVPANTPAAIFDTERWDPGGGDELRWDFPVPAGTQVQVRLFFANRCSCTELPGQRVFDVFLDGANVLDDLDLAGQVGHNVGTMRAFDITSDGNVDIDLGHVVENPLINGIEIVLPGTTPGDLTSVRSATFDGNDATSVQTFDTSFSWAGVRGATMIGDRLFYGSSDGFLHYRTFDGESFGPAVQINPYNDPAWANVDTGSNSTFNGRVPDLYGQLHRVTGMFYADGRLFYTMTGDGNLYWQLFSPDSGIVEPVRHQMTGSFDWSKARGMFAAEDELYVASTDGSLSRISLVDGFPSGGATVVDSPATGGLSWNGRAVFLSTFAPQLPNQAPTAAFADDCTFLDCAFDASSSSDPDGTIQSYAWDFGDGGTETGPTASHEYGAAGTYEVTLTVTDDDGASDTESVDVVVEEPPNGAPVAAFTRSCLQLECAFDGSGSSDADGTVQSYAWDFGDGGTSTEQAPAHAYAAEGTYQVSLTVTDNDGATDVETKNVTVSELSTAISFVGQDSVMGNKVTHEVTVPAGTQAGDRMVLVMSFNRTAVTVGDPSGAGSWSDLADETVDSLRSAAWSAVAGPGAAGQTVSVVVDSRTKASMMLMVYRGSSVDVPPIIEVATDPSAGTDRTTPTATVPASAWVLSYWADKSSDTTSWTPPAGVTTRAETYGTLGGHISALLADSNGPVPSGPYGGLVATTNAPSSMATMYTIALVPSDGTLPPAPPPTASFTESCLGLTCEFDATGSSGPVDDYAWEFEGGGTASGATPSHTFPAAGTYGVTLAVSNANGSDTASADVTVSEPSGEIAFVGQDSVMGNKVTHEVTVPAGTQTGDRMVLGMSLNRVAVTVGDPSGGGSWSDLADETVDSLRSAAWTAVAGPGAAGQTVSVVIDSRTKASMMLMVYRGSSTTQGPLVATAIDGSFGSQRTTPTLEVPAGSMVLSYWADKSSDTTSWTPPAGVTTRAETYGVLGGHISALLADSNGPVASGPYGGLVATTNAPSSMASTFTIALRP